MKDIQIKCNYKSPGNGSHYNVDILLSQST